jgi:putative flippase GtrA
MKTQAFDINEIEEENVILSPSFDDVLPKRVGFFSSLFKQVFSSVSATSVDFIISILLNRVFGVYYVYANMIGGAFGATTNFLIGRKWVFQKMDDRMRYQFLRFFILHMITISINSTLIYFVKENSGLPFEISKMLVATLFGFFFNFLMARYFVFHSWGKK